LILLNFSVIIKGGDNVIGKKKKFRAKGGYILFLMTLPVLIATFVFSYLPLWGWRYAFYDFRPGFLLADTNFVWFKHFLAPFSNFVLREELLRVMQNTLAMSFIGLAMSWLPMAFAIFLAEVRSKHYRSIVQTFTTIPHFISWVLVYALAFAMLSVNDGFVNQLLVSMGVIDEGINFLASPNNVWRNMWLYGTWKGLGWGAILYIASMASVDKEQLEAASIDGAGRFQKIWHITVPALMPTFFVLFVLSIANFLNNGIEQYFVFQNPFNRARIEVLDLYVFNQGMAGPNISYSTAVGMLKSAISIILLFSANLLSKIVRGRSVF